MSPKRRIKEKRSQSCSLLMLPINRFTSFSFQVPFSPTAQDFHSQQLAKTNISKQIFFTIHLIWLPELTSLDRNHQALYGLFHYLHHGRLQKDFEDQIEANFGRKIFLWPIQNAPTPINESMQQVSPFACFYIIPSHAQLEQMFLPCTWLELLEFHHCIKHNYDMSEQTAITIQLSVWFE